VRGRPLVPVVLAALLALAGQAARADSVGNRLGRARETQHQARDSVRVLQSKLSTLRARLARRQAVLDRATSAVLAARENLRNTTLRLDVAKDTLAGRVRAAYEYGPASTIGVLLAAQTPADLASADEFARSVITEDQRAVSGVVDARNAVTERQQTLEARQEDLQRRARQVTAILDSIRTKLSQAQDAARRADLQVASLQREHAALEAAQAREQARQRKLQQQRSADGQLVSGDGAGAGDGGPPAPVPDPSGFDQTHLLSLLGPTGGRTCGTPSGLRDTGQRLSGKATWYGPGFAGKHTASGAIFDPSLFTAAHRTLPFGTFLRVHHGRKCAIVLVNDRGPFNYDRIVDLSQAAGQYLGVSLTQVTVDILVPA